MSAGRTVASGADGLPTALSSVRRNPLSMYPSDLRFGFSGHFRRIAGTFISALEATLVVSCGTVFVV